MRQTKLKPTKRGYVRNLGLLPSGSQAKFYLGHERSTALARLNQITVLWQQLEERQRGRTATPVWDEETLLAARAIEKGESFKLGSYQFSNGNEPAVKYFTRINVLRQTGAPIEPSEPSKYELGRRDLVNEIENSHQTLSEVIGTPCATGQTLHQALLAYTIPSWTKLPASCPSGVEFLGRLFRHITGVLIPAGTSMITRSIPSNDVK